MHRRWGVAEQPSAVNRVTRLMTLRFRRSFAVLLCCFAASCDPAPRSAVAPAAPQESAEAAARPVLAAVVVPPAPAIPAGWYKGNLHTHSLWSDGDDYPEHIVRWYQGHGYHFLAISDHGNVQSGEKWVKYAD